MLKQCYLKENKKGQKETRSASKMIFFNTSKKLKHNIYIFSAEKMGWECLLTFEISTPKSTSVAKGHPLRGVNRHFADRGVWQLELLEKKGGHQGTEKGK